MSVPIGVSLPCIDRLLQGTLGTELLLQNYYNNVTVMSKRRFVNTDIMSIYMQTLLKQLKMKVMYDLFGAIGGGGLQLRSQYCYFK